MSFSSEFTDAQISALEVSNYLTAGFSIAALLSFFIGITLYPDLEKTLYIKLIKSLFFADLLYSTANVLSHFHREDAVCMFEAALRTFSLWSSVLWVTMISFTAYVKTVRNYQNIDNKYPYMLFIGYFIPFLVSLVPFLPNDLVYQSNGVYCWVVDSTGDPERGQIYLFLMWAWMAIITTTILYIMLFIYLKRLRIDFPCLNIKKLLYYPVILYIGLIPSTIEAFGSLKDHQFVIALARIVLMHSLGLFNVIAYGYQRVVTNVQARRSLLLREGLGSQKRNSSEHWDIYDKNGRPLSRSSRRPSSRRHDDSLDRLETHNLDNDIRDTLIEAAR